MPAPKGNFNFPSLKSKERGTANLLVANQTKRGRLQVPYVTFRGIEHKSCSSCGTLKPLAEFGEDSRKIDKLNSRCRECENARGRKKYHARS